MEFYQLLGYTSSANVVKAGILAACLVYIKAFLVAAGFLSLPYLSLIGLVPLGFLILALFSKDTDALKTVALIFLGTAYIVTPMASMHYLAFPASGHFQYSHRIILGLLILVWINDTGAYIAGSLFGRHKLFERISPAKSWEGFIGGTLLTLAGAFLMKPLIHILMIGDWIILAIIVSVFGVLGDLAESLIKRTANCKDSGKLIPGHGGALDRFDSILFVMPAAFVYLLLAGL
jgi:phosphatidate cytidylyltransferase